MQNTAIIGQNFSETEEANATKTAYYPLNSDKISGFLAVEYTAEKLVRLSFRAEPCTAQGERSGFSDLVRAQVCEYLAGERKAFSIPCILTGTAFQKSVFRAILSVPYGRTVSYGDVAKQLGKPKAVRAVGGALHRNPLLFLVPCHRVVGRDGKLTGFAGGVALKEYLLRLERENADAE